MTTPPGPPGPPGPPSGQPPVGPPDPQGARPDPASVGTVRLHLQGSVLTRMIVPSVSINGRWVPVSFGANDLPVHPGPITVHAQTQWLLTYGQAQLSFPVGAGELVEVWYVPPMHQFTSGSMGFEKQSSKGKALLVGILAVIVLVVVLAVLVGALGG